MPAAVAAQPEPTPAERAPEPAAAPEAPEVAVEAAPEVPANPVEPPLDISGYVSMADIERVIGSKTKFRRTELPGITPSPSYNALYYEPTKGDGFGIAIQVWRDSNLAESRTRFNTLRNTYSNVAPTNKITDQGFRSYFGDLVTLVFADPRRPLVAAVTCSTRVCDADILIELSKRAAERLR